MRIPFAVLLIAILSLSACSDKEKDKAKDAGVPSSERKEQRQELKRACDDDIQKFCKDVKPGEGGIGRCLREHKKELSKECRKELKARAENNKDRK